MTRIRVPYRGIGMIAAAVASVMSPNVFSQAGRATLIGAPANQQFCDYTTIATLPSGQVNITCGAVVPGAPGAVGFSSSAFAPVPKDAAVSSVPLTISVQRVGGTTGAVSATLNATLPCSPASQPVNFLEGIGGAVGAPMTANALGTCALTLTNLTGTVSTPTNGILASSVEVTLPAPGGGSVPAGCEGKTPTSNFVQHTSIGQAGSTLYFTDSGVGKIHSWPMPRSPNGAQVATGLIGYTASAFPGLFTPDTLWVEWSLSKCPGDTSYRNAPEAAVISRGVTYKPCGVESGWESGGIKWSLAGSSAQCKIPAGESWYVNLRYLRGCTGACSIVYFWQGI